MKSKDQFSTVKQWKRRLKTDFGEVNLSQRWKTFAAFKLTTVLKENLHSAILSSFETMKAKEVHFDNNSCLEACHAIGEENERRKNAKNKFIANVGQTP